MTEAPGYRIEGDSLREVVDDEVAARRWVEHLERQGERGDAQRVAWLRMLGDLAAAEELGWDVLTRAGGPHDLQGAARADYPLERGAIGAALRLAHVLHWRARFGDADVLFEGARAAALARCEDPDPTARHRAQTLVCFADQHQGKARLDAGRAGEALELFEAALRRRRDLGAPADQIASTVQAMAAARSRLDLSGA